MKRYWRNSLSCTLFVVFFVYPAWAQSDLDQEFHTAVVLGDFDRMEIALKNGADVNSLSGINMTALHSAVSRNSFELVTFLSKVPNLDPNVRMDADGKGWTPLFMSVAAKNKEMVQHLLNSVPGIDVNVTDRSELTPIMTAVAGNDTEMVRTLLTSSRDIDLEVEWMSSNVFNLSQDPEITEMLTKYNSN